MSKILSIHSNNSTSSSVDIAGGGFGHVWLAVTDTVSGERTTYGSWPDGHDLIDEAGLNNGPDGSDLRVNFVGDQGASAHTASWELTDEQYKRFLEFADRPVDWDLDHNCASWARDAVAATVDEKVRNSDLPFVESPRMTSAWIEYYNRDHPNPLIEQGLHADEIGLSTEEREELFFRDGIDPEELRQLQEYNLKRGIDDDEGTPMDRDATVPEPGVRGRLSEYGMNQPDGATIGDPVSTMPDSAPSTLRFEFAAPQDLPDGWKSVLAQDGLVYSDFEQAREFGVGFDGYAGLRVGGCWQVEPGKGFDHSTLEALPFALQHIATECGQAPEAWNERYQDVMEHEPGEFDYSLADETARWQGERTVQTMQEMLDAQRELMAEIERQREAEAQRQRDMQRQRVSGWDIDW